jgi:hypothetical protein
MAILFQRASPGSDVGQIGNLPGTGFSLWGRAKLGCPNWRFFFSAASPGKNRSMASSILAVTDATCYRTLRGISAKKSPVAN